MSTGTADIQRVIGSDVWLQPGELGVPPGYTPTAECLAFIREHEDAGRTVVWRFSSSDPAHPVELNRLEDYDARTGAHVFSASLDKWGAYYGLPGPYWPDHSKVAFWELPWHHHPDREKAADCMCGCRGFTDSEGIWHSAVADAFVRVFDGAASEDEAPGFTCDEADAIAAMLTELGRDDVAARWLAGHAKGDDDPDDRHHAGDEAR